MRIYTLSVRAKGSYQVALEGGERERFTWPDSIVCPKLYVVTQSRHIHYVGVTNRPMSARLRAGLKPAVKGGYHGYKWRGIREPLRLFVWSYPRKKKNFRRDLETIEAEFVFIVRKNTLRWPLSQTEIHFYRAQPAHLAEVKKMYLSVCEVL